MIESDNLLRKCKMKKKKNSQKSIAIHVKLLLTIFLFIIVGLIISYRIFEVGYVEDLNNTYREIKTREFELITETDGINVKYSQDFKGFFSEEQTTSQEEYVAILRIFRGRNQLYLDLINENKSKLQNLKNKAKYLVGARKTKIVEFLDTLNQYYDLEIESAESHLAYSDLLINSYKLGDDETIFHEFIDAYAWDQEKISNNFSELVALKKYANKNYEFSNIELIKKYNLKGYESLENRAEFLGSYYEALSEYSKGNDVSAGYKFEALNQKSTELDVDYDQINDDISTGNLERSKKIAQLTVNELALVQTFEKHELFDYSFMGNFSNEWVFEQTFCNLFAYKAGVYSEIKSQDIDFSSISELNEALVEIPPSFGPIEDSINLDSINYSNNEDTVVFECDGINENKDYTYTMFKSEE